MIDKELDALLRSSRTIINSLKLGSIFQNNVQLRHLGLSFRVLQGMRTWLLPLFDTQDDLVKERVEELAMIRLLDLKICTGVVLHMLDEHPELQLQMALCTLFRASLSQICT